MTSDPKPGGRIRDKTLLRRLHARWRECAVCGGTYPLSLHHVRKRPRDDVEANLVMLCGSGTTGCHGLVEARSAVTLRLLWEHIDICRPDVVDYLYDRMGDEQAKAWLRRNLYADV